MNDYVLHNTGCLAPSLELHGVHSPAMLVFMFYHLYSSFFSAPRNLSPPLSLGEEGLGGRIKAPFNYLLATFSSVCR